MEQIEAFLSYLTAERGYSAETVTVYREALCSLRAHFLGLESTLSWQTIDADIIRSWMAHCMENGQKPRTVGKELSAVRTFYRYLMRLGRAGKNPVRLISNPKADKPLPAFLRKAETDRLFDDVRFPPTPEGLRDRAILLTFYHTGIRLSELIGLRIADADTAQGELKVTGKRNKQRIVPFGPEAARALERQIAQRAACPSVTPASPLFADKDGLPLSKSRVERTVRAYLSLVTTQQKRSPHVLRHTFATQMLNHGADLEAIRDLLGHASIATTEIYTHTTFEDLKKEYRHAHPRAHTINRQN